MKQITRSIIPNYNREYNLDFINPITNISNPIEVRVPEWCKKVHIINLYEKTIVRAESDIYYGLNAGLSTDIYKVKYSKSKRRLNYITGTRELRDIKLKAHENSDRYKTLELKFEYHDNPLSGFARGIAGIIRNPVGGGNNSNIYGTLLVSTATC